MRSREARILGAVSPESFSVSASAQAAAADELGNGAGL